MNKTDKPEVCVDFAMDAIYSFSECIACALNPTTLDDIRRWNGSALLREFGIRHLLNQCAYTGTPAGRWEASLWCADVYLEAVAIIGSERILAMKQIRTAESLIRWLDGVIAPRRARRAA